MLSDNISVNILDVLRFRWIKGVSHTAKRPFHALSFRLHHGSRYLYKGHQIAVDRNYISYVPANIEYDRITDGDDMIVFHFDMTGFITDEIQVFTPPDTQLYRTLFEKALEIWQSKSSGYKYAATAVFYQILAQMKVDGNIEEKIKSAFISECAEYIEAHLSDFTLSVQSLAKRACVSESYFRRKFSESYGMSPKKYIDSLRIQHAAALLRSGYYSHKEIAAMCGYEDVKYFRTAFAEKTGKCISDYLRNF